MGIPCLFAELGAEAMFGPLGVNIQQRTQQILEHCILARTGKRQMEFAVQFLAGGIVERKRFGPANDRRHRVDIGLRRPFRCQLDDLAFENTSGFPQVADTDALHGEMEEGRVVDQGHPAKRPNDRAAAMIGLDDIECGQTLDGLPNHREPNPHRLGELPLRRKSAARNKFTARDPLEDRLRDLVGKRLDGRGRPRFGHCNLLQE